MKTPAFTYHPDPVATGSIRESDKACVCCGQARGFIYSGPAYATGDYDEMLCPWCIADGSANEKLGVSFTDAAGIGGYGEWDEVSQSVIEDVAYRTPGFNGWQQEYWWTHCNDAAQFLGRAGHRELVAAGAQAVAAIQANAGLDNGAEWAHFFTALNKDGSPTAYLFRCRHCGQLGGYQDSD